MTPHPAIGGVHRRQENRPRGRHANADASRVPRGPVLAADARQLKDDKYDDHREDHNQ